MQDEINAKVVALSVRVGTNGGRMTAGVLKAAMRKYLNEREKAKERKLIRAKEPTRGKQTVGELMKQGEGLTNIEITDRNIRSFERTAAKYHIDFALKKDKTADPPRYVVFFKAKDVDVMTVAFKEYSAGELKKEKKPSLKAALKKALDKSKDLSPDPEKTREREKNHMRGAEL